MTEPKAHSKNRHYFAFWILGLLIPLVAVVFGDNMPRYKAIRDLNQAGIEQTSASVHQAVGRGDLQTLKLLSTAKAPFNHPDEFGRTALINGVISKNRSVAEFLTSLPQVNCDQPDSEGATPLAHAIAQGNLDAVKGLLLRAQNPNVDLVEESGTIPALLKATQDRDGALLRLLLTHPRIDVDVVDGSGNTSLHDAIKQDDLLVARALVSGKRKPNPNITNLSGETPLQYAVHAGRADAVQLLLEHGARINEDDKARFLLAAVSKREPAIVRHLLAHDVNPDTQHPDTKISILNHAIEQQAIGCVVELLSAGATASGALERAIQCGLSDASRMIVAHYEQQQKPWAHKEGLLELAIYSNSTDCVDLILDNGADPNQITSSGQRVLTMALAARAQGAVAKLLNLGADPNIVMESPVSAEFLSFFDGDTKSLYYLKHDRNLTPLMLACLTEQLYAVRELIVHGADRNAHSSAYKRYAVSFAAERHNVPIMQLVLGREAGDMSRKAIVSLSDQRVTLFQDGEVINSSPVSTGKKGYRTPSGTFVVTNKYRHHKSSLYGSEMPYFMRLSCGDFGFHYSGSVPRYPASHGCIRMPWTKAQTFFGSMQVGDVVEIVQ